MSTRAHRLIGLPSRLWSTRVWPLLAGIATAVGVIAASTMLGVLPVLGIYVLLSLFAVVTVFGLAMELDIGRYTVLRVGLYGALVVVALMGLSDIHPLFGPLVALTLGLTSPAALGLVARTLSARRQTAEPPPAGVLMDKAMLDRRFDEIVSQLKASGEFPA